MMMEESGMGNIGFMIESKIVKNKINVESTLKELENYTYVPFNMAEITCKEAPYVTFITASFKDIKDVNDFIVKNCNDNKNNILSALKDFFAEMQERFDLLNFKARLDAIKIS